MRARWRWAAVLAVTALTASLPTVVRELPVPDSSVSAATLLSRIKASGDIGYSGYAQSTGGLSLPDGTGDLTSAVNLLGGTNQLRVWWRGTNNWRLDTLSLTGESDLHADSEGIWSWNYESDAARRTSTDQAPVRLPRSDDVLPGTLARRLLSEVGTRSVTRLPSARIAGHDAAGLRVTLDDPRSTIRHVDVWALPGDGLPLRVQVFTTASRAVISTSLLDVDVATPSPSVIDFHPVEGVRVQRSSGGGRGGLASEIDRFANVELPATLAGLPRRTDVDLGPVGIYGSGVTELVALPLNSASQQVSSALEKSVGAASGSQVAVPAGAINLLLAKDNPSRQSTVTCDGRGFCIGSVQGVPRTSGSGSGTPSFSFTTGTGRWLLVGTVTPATLQSALDQLPELTGGVVRVKRRPSR